MPILMSETINLWRRLGLGLAAGGLDLRCEGLDLGLGTFRIKAFSRMLSNAIFVSACENSNPNHLSRRLP